MVPLRTIGYAPASCFCLSELLSYIGLVLKITLNAIYPTLSTCESTSLLLLFVVCTMKLLMLRVLKNKDVVTSQCDVTVTLTI